MDCTTENIVNQKPSSDWLTNRKTGKTYRPDGDYGYVSKRRIANLPSSFHDNRKKALGRANQQLKPGKPGSKLLGVAELYLYSPNDDDLADVPAWVKAPEAYFDPEAAAWWREWVHRKFGNNPIAWGLHLGVNRGTHPHIIAGKNAGMPHLVRGSEKCEPIAKGDEAKVLAYLYKFIPPTVRNVKAFKRAVKKLGGLQCLPQTSGFLNCRAPKPSSFKYREWFNASFYPPLKVTFKCVPRDNSTKDTTKTNSAAQEKKLDAEQPVILRGSTPYEAEVVQLFGLWQRRKLLGVRLNLPSGKVVSCLETALQAYFRRWVLLPSECETLAEVLRQFENTLRSRRALWSLPALVT